MSSKPVVLIPAFEPRGYLIDYNDFDLLKEFTLKLKDYVKAKNGIFIKI